MQYTMVKTGSSVIKRYLDISSIVQCCVQRRSILVAPVPPGCLLTLPEGAAAGAGLCDAPQGLPQGPGGQVQDRHGPDT